MTHSMQRTFFTGTGLSTVVGLALIVVGLLSSSRWQISLLVGLVSILIGVLLTALYAFGRRLDEIDDHRIAVQSLHELYKVPHIEMPLVRIVDAVASTDQKRSSFLKDRTTKEVEQFSEMVARMADGAFLCRSREEELDLVKGALVATRREVRAVASRGAKWWLEPEADVYFQAYEDEARRLKITRIFLIRRDELERLRPMLERNGRAGVRTYALDVEQVPEGRRRGLVLFDDALLHRSAPRPEGVADPQDVEFMDVRDEIRRAEEDFEFLKSMATTRSRPSPAVLFAAEPKRFRPRIRGFRD